MKRILIADNYPLSAFGLQNLLSKEIFQLKLDIVTTEEDLRKYIINSKYDLLILALTYPGGNQLNNLRKIKKLVPSLPILTICIYKDCESRVLKLGASAFLLRSSSNDQILKSVSYLLNNKNELKQKIKDLSVSGLYHNYKTNSTDCLSTREFQVLQSLASGNSIERISLELNLRKSTVGTYRFRLMKKLDLKNTVELTKYAMNCRII